MKISDVRVGNLVYMDRVSTFPPAFISVEPIILSEIRLQDFEPVCLFAPISITEEWLTKFGFKTFSDNKGDYWSFEGLKLWNDGKSFYHINSELLFHIDYIHQLQNIFFCLTGEELKLK